MNSLTIPTTTIRLCDLLKLLPRFFRHSRARYLSCSRYNCLAGRPHGIHHLHRRGSCLMLKLEGRRHLILCPHLPHPCCTRAVWGVSRYIPWWLSHAFCSPNFHHSSFTFFCSRRFWGRTLEYLRSWPSPPPPPPLLLFVLVSYSKTNLKNYFNTCIFRQLVCWDLKYLLPYNTLHKKEWATEAYLIFPLCAFPAFFEKSFNGKVFFVETHFVESRIITLPQNSSMVAYC